MCLEEDVYTTLENIALRDGYQPPKPLAYFTSAVLETITSHTLATPKPNGQDTHDDPWLRRPPEIQWDTPGDADLWWSRLNGWKTVVSGCQSGDQILARSTATVLNRSSTFGLSEWRKTANLRRNTIRSDVQQLTIGDNNGGKLRLLVDAVAGDGGGLSYESQNESRHFRALRKAQEIRVRLGGSANMTKPFPGRPRYMHRRTYQHLMHQYEAAVEQYVALIM